MGSWCAIMCGGRTHQQYFSLLYSIKHTRSPSERPFTLATTPGQRCGPVRYLGPGAAIYSTKGVEHSLLVHLMSVLPGGSPRTDDYCTRNLWALLFHDVSAKVALEKRDLLVEPDSDRHQAGLNRFSPIELSTTTPYIPVTPGVARRYGLVA